MASLARGRTCRQGKTGSRLPSSQPWIFQSMPKLRQPRSGIRPATRQKGHPMRVYNQSHAYYCGVDLHARSLFVNVLDHTGQTRLQRDIPASPTAFLDAGGAYRDGLVVGCECMFAWYWLADLCEREQIPFVLGHALAMKAIHGAKAKNDRLDAQKIAALLKGGFFPMAHVYPKDKRETRDLLRQRSFFVRQRAQLIAHIQNTNAQYNLPPF